MSHNSGKESKACIHRKGERPQEYTQCQLLRISSLDTKYKIIGRIWYAPRGKKIQCKNVEWIDPSLPYRGAYIGRRSMV